MSAKSIGNALKDYKGNSETKFYGSFKISSPSWSVFSAFVVSSCRDPIRHVWKLCGAPRNPLESTWRAMMHANQVV